MNSMHKFMVGLVVLLGMQEQIMPNKQTNKARLTSTQKSQIQSQANYVKEEYASMVKDQAMMFGNEHNIHPKTKAETKQATAQTKKSAAQAKKPSHKTNNGSFCKANTDCTSNNCYNEICSSCLKSTETCNPSYGNITCSASGQCCSGQCQGGCCVK